MRIGVDIDNTIKETHRAAVEVYNEELEKNVKVKDVEGFYLDSFYNLTSEEGSKLWRKLEATIYQMGLPVPHAAEVLNDWVKEGHEIFFITARPDDEEIQKITEAWLHRHEFPFSGDNLIIGAQNKAEIARELNIGLFFEDAPWYLDQLVELGIPTVIMNQAYNQDYPHPLMRMDDWNEIRDLEQLLGKMEA